MATSSHGFDATVAALVMPLCRRSSRTAENVAPDVVGVTVTIA
jgi:hypothetical protein